MVEFLIDVNLPRRFKVWSTKNFLHVYDLNDEWSDVEIWNYARRQNLSIVTKDSDFSDKILSAAPPPKVILFRTGNMKMRDFHSFITRNWEEIVRMNQHHKLVNVYLDKITAIA